MKVIILTFVMFMSQMILAEVAVPPAVGNGTQGYPYQIATLENLYWIAHDTANWDKHYIQTSYINASATSQWFPDGSGGFLGWLPIGNATTRFTGSYDGQNNIIESLYCNRPTTNYIGLFGFTESGSSLSNINLPNTDVTGNFNVGALAGFSYSSVANCHSSGNISGYYLIGGLIGEQITASVSGSSSSANTHGISSVGGMIGLAENTEVNYCSSTGTVTGNENVGGFAGYVLNSYIENSSSSGSVSGSSIVGGFAGYVYNQSTIKESYSESTVTSSGNWTGGFAGIISAGTWMNRCTISDSYSTGSVTLSGYAEEIGGFAGFSFASIERSYSTGDVNASSAYYVGGFVGGNMGEIRNSFSTGDITADYEVGGFVGYNWLSNAYIDNSYSLGDVIGDGEVGAFAGYNDQEIYYCYAAGTVSGSYDTSAFVGYDDGNGSYIACFVDTDKSGMEYNLVGGIADPSEVRGRNTAQMTTRSNYTDHGWDFTRETANGTEDHWEHDGYNNNMYPFLSWQEVDPAPLTPPAILDIVYTGTNPELSWSLVPSAHHYSVYSSQDPNSLFPDSWTLELSEFTGLSWTDMNTVGNRKFYIVTSGRQE